MLEAAAISDARSVAITAAVTVLEASISTLEYKVAVGSQPYMTTGDGCVMPVLTMATVVVAEL